MTDDRESPERPTKDRGNLYVLSEEDIAELTAELFARYRERPKLTETDANELAHEAFTVFTDPDALDSDDTDDEPDSNTDT